MFPFSFYHDAVEMFYNTPQYKTVVFQFITVLRYSLCKITVNYHIILIFDNVGYLF